MAIIIADCGSTKIEWALIERDNAADNNSTFVTTGFNAAVTAPEEICRILNDEVKPQLCGKEIAAVHFYGAGCIGGDVNHRLESCLRYILDLPSAVIEISGDLLAAARALFGDTPGIACIIGTGSNCGIYDGHSFTLNTPPMGFILGDEGSGAVLGRKLLNLIFKHPGLLPSDIIADFNDTYAMTKTMVIERVYRQPASNRFLASFAPFIKKYADNKVIAEMLRASFRDFFTANLPARYLSTHDKSDPDISSEAIRSKDPIKPNEVMGSSIGFVGSIAYHFADIIRPLCTEYGLTCVKILRAPLIDLIHYHLTYPH